jgi:hypothetical protein
LPTTRTVSLTLFALAIIQIGSLSLLELALDHNPPT